MNKQTAIKIEKAGRAALLEAGAGDSSIQTGGQAMITRATEQRFYEFLGGFNPLDLTFRDDVNNYGRRVIKHKPTGRNIASVERFINQSPVCHIDTGE